MARPNELDIEHRQDVSGHMVALSGELDIASAPRLQSVLDELRVAAGQRIVLDLSRLSFMDSTGLNLLIRARQDADANGHEFHVSEPTSQVRRLLELMGLQTLLVTGQ